jgi:hypothetical protein
MPTPDDFRVAFSGLPQNQQAHIIEKVQEEEQKKNLRPTKWTFTEL